MKQATKDWVQYGSAIAMLASSIVLALWSFYAISEVHGTVLTYVGEAIAFAAGVYGLALYARNEIRREFRNWERTSETTAERSEEQQDGETNAEAGQ